ncbi:hypothetical protein GCK72_010768 [Caenorhabditis remanei]|uniref:Serpentine receptor class gamma n=1 Tax=Caenorhabditis remanei TaxID=31234 RepID=A0A6A5H6L9_CAERE|nr:hypothetical protein GCK72_010768 [Caenorhabditis remanei]KAF1762506.1 hypothetical protein GCK72_010768 [Caenorhabditis remanei]
MDSVVGLLLLLLDIFITRFFVYVPQLCTPASQFFQSHPSFMNIYYPLLSYLHCAQPLIQIFLTLNRMSSVVWPVDHNKVWKKNLPFIFFFILLTPFLFIWNTIISQKVVVYYFGGFFMIGLKAVEWADISLFLFSVRSVAVMITVTSTVIMFLRMSKMKKRLKSSERILCLACVIHSICFMIPSFFEALALFNEEYGKSWINFLIQPFAWDVLNVGSPLIMIFVSGQLRNHVFDVSIGCLKKKKDPRRVKGLVLLLLDIFITRLFVYFPQLCVSGSEFFLSYPIFMAIYYPLLNYLHCAQPLIQIFLTLNRMSSVVWPVDHNKLWKKNLPFIFLFILLVPFLFIWNTIISQKILIYYFGGFYINCLKLVPWASMSLFTMVIRSVAVGITVVSTVITFWKMSNMKNRLKKSERTLCFACAANSVCFIIPAGFEAMKVLNSFWSTYWLAYLLQPFAWDVLNVGSPLVMIFVSDQLRGHVFGIDTKKKTSMRSNSIVVSSVTN